MNGEFPIPNRKRAKEVYSTRHDFASTSRIANNGDVKLRVKWAARFAVHGDFARATKKEERKDAAEKRLELSHKLRGEIARFTQPSPFLRLPSFCSFPESKSPRSSATSLFEWRGNFDPGGTFLAVLSPSKTCIHQGEGKRRYDSWILEVKSSGEISFGNTYTGAHLYGSQIIDLFWSNLKFLHRLFTGKPGKKQPWPCLNV